MAGISSEMIPKRVPVTLVVRPCFFDHVVAGRAVLPMVEILLLLAVETKKCFPDVDVRVMKNGCFVRFLEILPGAAALQLAVELEPGTDGSVQAVLLQKKVLSGMTRMVEYARVIFSGRSQNRKDDISVGRHALFTKNTSMDAQLVYKSYISFGAAYQSLKGSLEMNDREVRAHVQAPLIKQRDPGEDLLGSPFPLDGAMHAAGMFGRRRFGCIPLPVEFGGRVVHRPTRPDTLYTAVAVLLGGNTDRLSFDLLLEDDRGRVCEELRGLVMQRMG